MPEGGNKRKREGEVPNNQEGPSVVREFLSSSPLCAQVTVVEKAVLLLLPLGILREQDCLPPSRHSTRGPDPFTFHN